MAEVFSSVRAVAGEAILSGGGWWPLLWLGVLILVAAWGLGRLAPWFGVLGRGGETVFVRRAHGLTLVGITILGVAVSEVALVSLPLVAFVVAVIVLPVILVATGVLQDTAGGLATQFRLRPSPGDTIRVGDISGHLLRVGVLRTRLGVEEGGDVFVPNRLFIREPVYHEPARSGHRLVVTVSTSASWSAAQLVELRARIILLPYRVPGSPVDIDTGHQTLTINTQVWIDSRSGLAERAVRQLCEDANPPPPAA